MRSPPSYPDLADGRTANGARLPGTIKDSGLLQVVTFATERRYVVGKAGAAMLNASRNDSLDGLVQTLDLCWLQIPGPGGRMDLG